MWVHVGQKWEKLGMCMFVFAISTSGPS